jgi:hypothetical protein
MTAWAAAVAYFATAFVAGFVLRTARVLVIAPRIGGFAAVLLELPIMLGVSWLAARALVRRLRAPVTGLDGITMGFVALVLLLWAEVLLGVMAFGRTLPEQVATWLEPEGLLGLAGQVAFGLLPVIQIGTDRPLSPET